MEVMRHTKYRIGSSLLIGLAFLLIFAAMLNDWQLQSFYLLLMLSATGFIGGAFLYAIGGDEHTAADLLASQISLQGSFAAGRPVHKMCGFGKAIFLPPDGEDGKVMQFVPAQKSRGWFAADTDVFPYRHNSRGTLISPPAISILEDLKRDSDLVLPSTFPLLMGAIREVCEDVLFLTDRADMHRDGDMLAVTLKNYRFFSGCASHREASPECCEVYPCATCSLIACIIAESRNCRVSIGRVTLDSADRSLRLALSCDSGIPSD